MKVSLIVSCVILLSTLCAFAQTGFFFVDNKGHCSIAVKSVNNQDEYCITEEPIIKGSEFKTEGNLQYDLTQQNQFFNIRFTKNGFETLKLICEHMPEKGLVLVVNGKVAGTYDGKNLKPTLVMPVSGKANSKEITWVFENLKNHK